MEINFLPLTVDDLPIILPYEQQLFDFPYSFQQYYFEVTKNNLATYFKMQVENQLVGWAGIVTLLDQCQLLTIAIVPGYQSQGYGRKLLQHCIDLAIQKECHEILLEVDTANTTAFQLYDSMGFKQTRRRKHYYGNRDGIEMKKELA